MEISSVIGSVKEMHSPGVASERLASIDAYRGLVLLLMLGEVLSLRQVSEALPGSGFWAFLAHQQSHVAWVGCSLHDLIQPSFSFLVGTALAFSVANRANRGQSLARLFGHAVWRSFVLIGLGIFLRSMGKSQTYFTFEDTLTQIGLGYPFLFVIALRPQRDRWILLFLLLTGFWLAFALYPRPDSAFDWSQTGLTADWEGNLSGFAAHWNKNTNLSWAFDRWFLNLFPRETEFVYNRGGYATLSFIPTLGTMILGLIAGGWLRGSLPVAGRLNRLCLTGVILLLAGVILHILGICPIVKRIWTPAWTLFSGGWCFLILAFFYAGLDVSGARWWGFPLIVFGMNSIVAYSMEWLGVGFVKDSLNTHLGEDFFSFLGAAYTPALQGVAVLGCLWLFLWWMYRKKIFVKI